MAWKEPKTDWKAGDGVSSDDFNRIEGNIKDLNKNKMNKNGGTFTGIVKAQNNTAYTTKQIRNIYLSSNEPSALYGDNGDIWIKYR